VCVRKLYSKFLVRHCKLRALVLWYRILYKLMRATKVSMPESLLETFEIRNTDFSRYVLAMFHLTMGIRSEKCVVKWYRRRSNFRECTYTNLETWHWLGFLMDESPIRLSVSRIGRLHPYWRFGLASYFPPQSAYLELQKILTTVVYAVRRWPKRRYAAHGCSLLLQQQYKFPLNTITVGAKTMNRKGGLDNNVPVSYLGEP
jgi:hypothetical protein